MEEISRRIIGKSWLGKDIYAYNVGRGKRKILIISGLRGSDGKIARALAKVISNVPKEINADKLFSSVTLNIIPAINPDGMEIRENGIDKFNPFRERCVKINPNGDDFSSWQANARGTDVFFNFPEGWQQARLEAFKNGASEPSPEGYTGEYPESEAESAALCAYTKLHRHDGIIVLTSDTSDTSEGFVVTHTSKSAESIATACFALPAAKNSDDKNTKQIPDNGTFGLWANAAVGANTCTAFLPKNDEYGGFVSKALLAAAIL